MTTIHVPPSASSAAGRPPGAADRLRDRTIDLIRSASLVLVVLLHAMMVGVTVTDAGPVFENALETAWFGPVSWLVQMMPLFFIAGGFTAAGSWRAARASGATATTFVARRVKRLMAPAIALFAVIAVGLATLSAAGVAPDVVATAGFRISQPLWFLGVFLLAQALVPAMVRLHERSPFLTAAALLTVAGAIDAVRFATGWEAIGFVNLAVVWLFVQQLGFFEADGFVARVPHRVRAVGAPVLIAGLVILVATTPYVADMYANQDPPTLLLALFGAAQLLLLSLARPRLARWMRNPAVERTVDWIGARSMTIYLWHMSVLIALAGIGVLAAQHELIVLPELHSAAWWLPRPAWLACAVVAVLVVAVLAARFEPAVRRPSRTPWRSATAAAVGIGCVAVVFVVGLSWPTALACAALAAAAAALAGDGPLRGRRRRAAADALPTP
ncbi:acyltransferase family protein [Microbacterium halophytorum]|uniref:acyltransferase family protein n=1 Tax=Microbacterium halophytorum TaxID=2067568 RepID=UPI000CFD8AD5|nr:acyltransferase [Microbacterium halophytorum]